MSKRTRVESALTIFACLLSVAPTIPAQTADAAAKGNARAITIPAGELNAALESLAAQTGVQLLYDLKHVQGVRTAGVSGLHSPQAAVTALLKGTALTTKTDSSGAILISASPAAVDVVPLSGVEAAGSDLAQPTSLERSAIGRDREQSLEEVHPKTAAIPEVLVYGKRTLNTDIERTENDVQPYVVFGKEEIARSQAASLDDFLRTRLPMNTVNGSYGQVDTSDQGNQSSINLRGLGVNDEGNTQTLILVDGRRLPSTFKGGIFHQPDINGIPLSAIERIEVLPSTAGGMYGGGATGGVVNIILKRDYAGVDARITYGNSFESDVADRRMDLSGGFTLEDGRTQVMVAASSSDSNPLTVGERDFAQRTRALLFGNDPGALLNPASLPPEGYTTNIRSQNGSNLVLDSGVALGSNITFVPVGYAGPASDGGAAFVTNAGHYNLDTPNTLNGSRRSLVNNPRVLSLMGNVRREFGDHVDAFIDVSWFENRGRAFSLSSFANFLTLPAAAPNNPFNTAVVVTFPATNLSFTNESESETLRTTAGLIARLPHDWTAALEYGWGRSTSLNIQTNPVLNSAGAAAFLNGTLNVMRDLNAFPLDYSSFLLPRDNRIQGPSDLILRSATLRVAGPLFKLPGGGTLSATGLVERREEEAQAAFWESMNTSGVTTISWWPDRSQTVDSVYLEARASLISKVNALPGVRDLELQASMRRDAYETESVPPGTLTVPSRQGPFPDVPRTMNEVEAAAETFGLRYSPLDAVTLRASYATGFLPPNVSQIVAFSPFTIPTFVSDPKRDGVSRLLFVTATAGGNPDLVPEESESWSAGLILTPRFLSDLRLSLDYTRIEKTNEISGVTQQLLVDNEDLLPGRVTRAPLTAADVAAGYTAGQIIGLDQRLLNIAATTVEAYDLQADYTVRTGRFGEFHLYTVVTRQTDLSRQLLPTSPVIDPVGYSDGPLQWRGNIGAVWDFGPWTLGWDAQHYDSYLVYRANSSPTLINSTVLRQGSRLIPSQTYHDLSARYRFADSASFARGLFAGTEIVLGIQNVLDEAPPILASASAAGSYSSYGDPRMRRYTVSVQKSF